MSIITINNNPRIINNNKTFVDAKRPELPRSVINNNPTSVNNNNPRSIIIINPISINIIR